MSAGGTLQATNDTDTSNTDPCSTELPTNDFLDVVIMKLTGLLGARRNMHTKLLQAPEIKQLQLLSRDAFMAAPTFLEVQAPVTVVGDVHGQIQDLLGMLHACGPPATARYLFTGDYVDRGRSSLECICLLLAYYLRYPGQVTLLRGNHECAAINRIYGFYDECKRRYNIKLWKGFADVFNCMPLSAIVEGRMLCMHGGLSPDLKSLELLKNIIRPTDVPDTGLVCDLLWADPSTDLSGWGESDRGVSYCFGADVVKTFLQKHDLDLIVRGHQIIEDGYQFFADRGLVTIFSAPNYLGDFENTAAVLRVDADLVCSFTMFTHGRYTHELQTAFPCKSGER